MKGERSTVLGDDLNGLRQLAKAPGVSGKWQELRKLVRRNHPQLWDVLRDARHFARDLDEDWSEQGAFAAKRHGRRILSELIPRQRRKSSILWLDLGDLGDLRKYSGGEPFQDHGLGLLRTILHNNGIVTDIASTRNAKSMDDVAKQVAGYDMMLMNVRSYRFDIAVEAAERFKQANPQGIVAVGGMHTMVVPEQMESTPVFDKICIGPGEKVITDLVTKPETFPRVFQGEGARSMEEWPVLDRTLWPKPANWFLRFKYNWPLEAGLGWGPRPVASLLTSRVCPWQCAFCNEASYIPNMRRRSVDSVIDELNELDEKYRIGSFVIHDSMFFQHRSWLEEWLEKYPRRARKRWPYWAAARVDAVSEWPELFEALIKETNWNVVSIGFESGSDPMLKMLNKQVTEEENNFVIELVNRIGDEMEQEGKKPVTFWSNIMVAIPGETHEDAFKTIRMVKRMKRARPAVAFYAPFPGSALGYQLIAEGKNLTEDDYRRGPRDEKVRGIDYQFYRDLFRGKHDDEINRGLTREERERVVELNVGEVGDAP
jgi:radical SAM superfamily enzyme YgiQ (UPF0313 family)